MTDPRARQSELLDIFETYIDAGLKLDLTRGKPAAEQLDLSNDLDGILEGFYLLQGGTDVRNYGGILGIPEARQLGAEFMGVKSEQVMVGGNSSLNLMYQYVEHMMAHWGGEPVKFLCPVPGYDRHFTICEHFDIEMITVPLNDDGPDMQQVKELVSKDAAIKGIWCVPKYSNPTGNTYSKEVVEQFAEIPKVAGDNFRVFWDNAYAVHDLVEQGDELPSLMTAAEKAGTTDSIVMLGSTSKVTFAGAGISFLATSTTQLAAFEKFLSDQMIGFDKVNQLRHVRFLKDIDGIKAHMAKHRDIIKPKFDLVLKKLEEHLAGKNMASWNSPRGGYFISLDTRPGLATTIISMAADAGVKLTPAGATFPYGKDPKNTNIRLAPTFPGLAELESAMDVFVTCVELASLNAELD
ncbi:MAG: aminotransferase class I/II-fold pyridoxal phosphate-dependent enzyme [Gammaproteobacteria bacterium]|jgi:DNA-binding transcriptional MocR family regulator|nr:aminotransferase class I/II-fold pyridoxal phosphate-dependent enzyme [Gammaproteobacteria bacterium]MBT3867282.1 aminotransferase class I/II-fold pyridoxal phosphate-dependent enzyme [Gammaproteobacteria bacterium]MBT4617375.1 aminotransferase class I/II-fold pyridoxal phosphate-dependent enzyme [Gammaproteobacteria bacterium]MBT5197260.1 aminotransferase class I/II-fold pyridoxal phosphate-dependent enzyme [Gammaproteobacteria bacterium]MBT5442238.1 aminotransferase class I/II-fold pyridox